MASVKKLESGKWQVRFRDPSSRQRARNFRLRADADRFAAKVKVSVDEGTFIDPTAAVMTFDELANRWQKTRLGLAKSTRDQDRHYLTSLILPEFGGQRVRAITHSQVAAWVAGLDVAPATAKKALQKVSAVLKLAVRDRVLDQNPCDGVTRPTVESRAGKALDADAVARVLDAAEQVDSDTAAMVWLMVGGGLRVGEVIGLKRSDVDLAAGTLRVARSMSRSEGVKAPKTDAGVRTIPLPSDTLARLAEHMQADVVSIDGWLFTAPMGGPVSYTNWRQRVWSKIVKLADVDDVNPHDLRHTAGSRLIDEGWTLPQVARFLGHADSSITAKVYVHLIDEELPVPSDVHELCIPSATGTDDKR